MKACVLILALALAACGSVQGPTAPTTSGSTVSTPEAPPASPPAPEPAPAPAPIPTPPPAPQPPPEPVKAWHATTETAQWYIAPAPLPSRFDVEWRYDTLWFGPIVATIAAQDKHGILATIPPTVTIQIVLTGNHGTWTFNGIAGQASGTLIYE